MENISIFKFLAHQELFRNIKVPPSSSTETGAGLGCSITGVPYTSQDKNVGEDLYNVISKAADGDKVLIIHDADQDGIVSGLLLEDYITDVSDRVVVNMLERMHGPAFLTGALATVELYREGYAAFILDQSFNKELYEKLCSRFKHVFWIDHHPVTTENDVEIRAGIDSFYIYDAYSTANLVWRMTAIARSISHRDDLSSKHLNIEIETLAYLTHFNDTWQYSNNDHPAHAYISKSARDLASWFDLAVDRKDVLRSFLDCAASEKKNTFILLNALKEAGDAITKTREMIHQRLVQECIGQVTWRYKGEVYRIGYAMHSDARSKLAQDILGKYPDLNTAMIVFYSERDGKMRFSLRGRDDGPAVSEICEFLGGAGHRNAAGFGTDPSLVGLYLQDRAFSSESATIPQVVTSEAGEPNGNT